MNIEKYWIKHNVDYNILKNFCHVFNHKHRQIKVTNRIFRIVPVDDILVSELDGIKYKMYDLYKEVMDIYIEKGTKYDYTKTRLWEYEWSIAPKNNKAQVEKRFISFFNLFDSIRKKGYKKRSNGMVRLLDIEGKPRSLPVSGERFSEKYYRISGMKRCIISKYLGIKNIPCRILEIKVVPI